MNTLEKNIIAIMVKHGIVNQYVCGDAVAPCAREIVEAVERHKMADKADAVAPSISSEAPGLLQTLSGGSWRVVTANIILHVRELRIAGFVHNQGSHVRISDAGVAYLRNHAEKQFRETVSGV